MAVQYYYFDASVSGPTDNDNNWAFDDNAFSGTLNYARCTFPGTDSTNELRATGSTAPSSGDSITQVRIRTRSSSSTDTGDVNSVVTSEVFDSSTSLGSVDSTGDWNIVDGGLEWTDWVTLSAPSGGWTWAKLNTIENVIYRDSTASTGYNSMAITELEVTSGTHSTYYFDASEAGPTDPDVRWADPDSDGFDGSLTSSTTASSDGTVDTNELRATGSTAPASGDTISLVQVRIHGGTYNETANFLYAEVLDGSTSLGVATLSDVNYLDTDWSKYETLDAPAGGWTWAKLNTIECVIYGNHTEGSGQHKRYDLTQLLVTTTASSSYNLAAATGSYSLTGVVAAIEPGFNLKSSTGAYTLTGIEPRLQKEGDLKTDVGSYTLTGISAILKLTRALKAATGSYSLNGQPANILPEFRLTANVGSYALTGIPANLDTEGALQVDVGSYILTGKSANLGFGQPFQVDTGSYTLTGIAANLQSENTPPLVTDVGSYVLSGKSARLRSFVPFEACVYYSFKREVTVWIIDNVTGFRYKLDLSEINFNQTFQEHSYSIKTLHAKNMFEQSVINKANPANFDITLPQIREADLRVIFDKAIDYQPFDIYVESAESTFLVENCVITNTNFIIEKMRPLTLGVTGEASRISKNVDMPTSTEVPRSSTMTYNQVSDLDIDLAGAVPIGNALYAVTIELQNEVQWTPYTTVNAALDTTDVTNSMYPNGYTVKKRILSGTFSKYLMDTEAVDLFKWNTNTALSIFAGQDGYGFTFDIFNCTYTNRIGTGEVFTQSYDWRMINNNPLTDIITYITDAPVLPSYETTAKAIEGEFSQYQSYDKAQMIPSGNSNYCTFACFMRIPHKTANYEGFIFGNPFCQFWTRNFGWYGGTVFPNLPNTIYLNLNDASYNDYYGVSQDLSVHGIDVGDWFALMISADLSASPAEVKIFVQKVGESTVTDISIVTPWGDDSPILMEFDSAGGSICAMNSHPNFQTQSLDSEVCELYFSNELVDWTNPAVKDLYIDPVTGKPVGLTTGGANLTGTAAAYYIPNGDGTDNTGTAGNFTEIGTILDASTSPTD